VGEHDSSLKVANECSFCQRSGSGSFSTLRAGHHGSLHSTFLFPTPSILYSFGRLVDLGGQLDSYNVTPTPADADIFAFMNDWSAVSDDLREAFGEALMKYLTVYLESDEGRELRDQLQEKFAER
jgi:hypothetical protein